MKPSDFLYDKLGILLTNFFALLFLDLFLLLMGNKSNVIYIITTIWLLTILTILANGYLSLKRKYKEADDCLDRLNQKYLISGMLKKPSNRLEALYYNMLLKACKSMNDEVAESHRNQREYKEYIEEWIHEIKTPLAAIDLICKNHPNGENSRITKELTSIHSLLEQALFYARSEALEKDYFISKVSLSDMVQTSLLEFRQIILENSIELTVDSLDVMVNSDVKWCNFIINQILSNSIKYRKTNHPKLHIYSESSANGVSLWIEDNGTGISEADLPRIFDKGFTGSNRNKRKSTGIGLYLCKKLSDKMGLSLEAHSKLSEYTKICIFFPVGTFTDFSQQASNRKADTSSAEV